MLAFMCSFNDSKKAVNFALKVQLELIHADWPPDLLTLEPGRIEYDDKDPDNLLFRGLRVRMGLHAGRPIVERDPITGRADYFGPVVNRAARVEGQAKGGQIAISSAVWAEINDEFVNMKAISPDEAILSDDESFCDSIWTKLIGTVMLKGMDQPETVRLILPKKLMNRKWPETPTELAGDDDDDGGGGGDSGTSNDKNDSSSMDQLKRKLLYLEQEHQRLEDERGYIEERAKKRFDLTTLETAMLEKDNVISYLKEKLSELSVSYERVLSSKDESQRKEIEKKTLQLRQNIEEVLHKYEDMQIQYSELQGNYENVVRLFNLRLKRELNQFKSEINDMNKQMINRDNDLLRSQKKWNRERDQLHDQLTEKEKELKEKDDLIMLLKEKLRTRNQTGPDKTVAKTFGDYEPILNHSRNHNSCVDNASSTEANYGSSSIGTRNHLHDASFSDFCDQAIIDLERTIATETHGSDQQNIVNQKRITHGDADIGENNIGTIDGHQQQDVSPIKPMTSSKWNFLRTRMTLSRNSKHEPRLICHSSSRLMERGGDRRTTLSRKGSASGITRSNNQDRDISRSQGVSRAGRSNEDRMMASKLQDGLQEILDNGHNVVHSNFVPGKTSHVTTMQQMKIRKWLSLVISSDSLNMVSHNDDSTVPLDRTEHPVGITDTEFIRPSVWANLSNKGTFMSPVRSKTLQLDMEIPSSSKSTHQSMPSSSDIEKQDDLHSDNSGDIILTPLSTIPKPQIKVSLPSLVASDKTKVDRDVQSLIMQAGDGTIICKQRERHQTNEDGHYIHYPLLIDDHTGVFGIADKSFDTQSGFGNDHDPNKLSELGKIRRLIGFKYPGQRIRAQSSMEKRTIGYYEQNAGNETRSVSAMAIPCRMIQNKEIES